MLFKQFLESNGIQAYHGSRTSGLSNLRGGAPPYEGGLGAGVYLGLRLESAQYFGKHVYEVRLNFGWESILRIDGENYDPVEELQGNSILIGEHIPAFAFQVKNKRYVVIAGSGWPDENQHPMGIPIAMDQIAEVVQKEGFRAVYVNGIRYYSSVNEELLVFNQQDVSIVKQLS